MTDVKICGLSDPQGIDDAIMAGARFIGLVFVPDSPRFVSMETAALLARRVPAGVRTVGLFVNPGDAILEHAVSSVPLDMIQLHGDETPGRVAEVKSRTALSVMKAMRVADEDDLIAAPGFEAAADWLLFDKKSDETYGGTGESFDWSLLKDRTFKKPWMLAGGLNAANVADALRVLSPDAVDVSSGVELARGIKDSGKITAFIQSVQESTN